jgi:nucleoside 2-deoxyribosyltransferase
MATAKPRRSIFVLQPFSEGSEAVYQLIVSSAAPSKASVSRADLLAAAGITESIERAISDATLIIADITDSNPSVMYEVGLARARNKPLIMIATSSRSIPFDIANVRVIILDLNNPNEFVSRLSAAIDEAFKNPNQFRAQARERDREQKTSVFVSYSHTDADYLDRLLVHLKPLEKSGALDLWVDTRLRAGDKWKVHIERALERATVAILLVSADFLASDFITDNELPPLLKNAEERGTVVIPVILKPCRFARDAQLRTFQAVNDPKHALILLGPGQQEAIYDQVASEVERRLAKT